MRILLADDSTAMRTMLRESLVKLGHSSADILEAPDVDELVRVLNGPGADLIVYDWDMPGIPGADLTWKLRDAGLAGKISVLFCVSRAQRSQAAAHARVGCDFVERPFTEEQFKDKLSGLGAVPEPRKKKKDTHSLYAIAPMPDVARDVPFLRQLEAKILDDLLALASVGRHEPGAILLRPSQLFPTLSFVTQGQIEVLGADGRRIRTIGEGDAFGELSFMTSSLSTETFKALTRLGTASLSRDKLNGLLRARPTFAGYLSALMARHKKSIHERASTLERADFKGSFDTFPFADVMQMLISTRKTGVLGLRADETSGAIYLEDGEALHAWTETLQGEPAFLELAGWSKARFGFTTIRRQEPRTLPRPTISLLMKVMAPPNRGF